jgi:putative membrane protein
MTLAHHPIGPSGFGSAWDLDPLVIGLIVGAAVCYARGIASLRRSGRAPISNLRALAFYGGLGVAAIALISPLGALADTLFSAHMVQHLLLILCVAPLIIFGAPVLPVILCLPVPVRRTLHRLRHGRPSLLGFAVAPITAVVLHAVAMWSWHLPTLYEAGLRNEMLHGLEHASFLVTAILIWSIVIPAPKRPPRFAAAIGVTFATALQSGALGGILTFATAALYPVHSSGASLWNLTLLEDQQLAGVIMWIPAGAVYFLAMAVLFAQWLNSAPREDMPNPLIAGPDEK